MKRYRFTSDEEDYRPVNFKVFQDNKLSWVRPDLYEFLRMKQALQEHVLNGGLVLETELYDSLNK